ncbi:hypothetical protein F5888DRAFT_1636966 [Russula emetica]|nr:hypothetical protein F5888DRAFT_1636966 [Russula emetica]
MPETTSCPIQTQRGLQAPHNLLFPPAPALALAQHSSPSSTALLHISPGGRVQVSEQGPTRGGCAHKCGNAAYACSKRSDSRRAPVYAVTTAVSAVVRADSAVSAAFVFVLCAASSTARTACSGWRVNSSARTLCEERREGTGAQHGYFLIIKDVVWYAVTLARQRRLPALGNKETARVKERGWRQRGCPWSSVALSDRSKLKAICWERITSCRNGSICATGEQLLLTREALSNNWYPGGGHECMSVIFRFEDDENDLDGETLPGTCSTLPQPKRLGKAKAADATLMNSEIIRSQRRDVAINLKAAIKTVGRMRAIKVPGIRDEQHHAQRIDSDSPGTTIS